MIVTKILRSIWIMLAIGMVIPLYPDSALQPRKETIPDKDVTAKYLNVGKKDYLLVFYGYVGCTKVCTPVLDNLNRFYSSKDFLVFEPYVDLIFVNLLPEVSKEQPDQFAKSFNRKFLGVYLSEKELSQIDKELHLYFSKKVGDSFEIDHSDNLYFIRRDQNGSLKLVNIYTTHPLNHKIILEDLAEHIKDK